MPKHWTYIVLLFAIAGLIGIFPSTGLADEIENSTQFYNQCIAKEVSKSQSKVNMLYSRSSNLREYAFLETQKAAFYANEKN